MRRSSRPRISSHALACALVFATAVVVYANSLSNGLVFDDVHKITEDARLRRLDPGELFATNYWGAYSPEDVTYRPLVNVTYALNYAFSGLDAAPYHAVNILLHALNAVCVLLLARRLLGDVLPASAAALTFAAHPIHTEAVANVVGRAELLCFAFALTSLLAFLRARERDAAGWWMVSIACYLLALLSKETAVLLPLLVLLWEVGVQRRAPAKLWPYIGPYVGLVGALVLFLGVRKMVVGSVLAPAIAGVPAADPLDRLFPLAHLDTGARLLTALSALGRYVALLIFPVRLCGDYSYAMLPDAHRWSDPGVAAGVAAALGVALGAVIAFVRNPPAFWSIAVFVLTLLPASNFLFPAGTVMAERFLYFPSLGFCLLLGVGLARVGAPDRGVLARTAWAAVALVLALYAARTVLRNPVWAEEERFWAITAEECPRSSKALYNHGKRLMDRWMAARGTGAPATDPTLPARAEERFAAALAINPQLYRAHLNIGVLCSLRQDHARSEEHYRRAAAVAPAAYAPWVNLAYDYAFRGEAAATAGRAAETFALRRRAVGAFAEAEKRLENRHRSPEAEGTLAQVRATRATIEQSLR